MQPKSSKSKKVISQEPFIQNWNAFNQMHPYEDVVFPTDKYYADLAQKIRPMLGKMRTAFRCPQEVIMRISLCLAAYFEDQISKLGLWEAFVHHYHETYGRWLPWYDTTGEDADYFEDEVNLQDVKFLIWIILVSTQGQYLTPPDDPVIADCSKRVFDLLMCEFETAPANEALVSLIYDPAITKDFLSFKHILNWMTKTCYLMAVPSWETEIRSDIRNLLMNMDDGTVFNEDATSYLLASYSSMRMRFGPLALYPNQWYVLMRQQKGIEKDNDKILAIKSTPFYPFLVISNDGKNVEMVSCRGIQYKVEVQSFKDCNADAFQSGDIIMATLVKYKGKWGINGLSMILSKGSDIQDNMERLKELVKLGLSLKRDGYDVDAFGQRDPDFKGYIDPSIKRRLNKAIADNKGKRLFYFRNVKSALKWRRDITGAKDSDSEKELHEHVGDRPLMIYVRKDFNMMSSAYVYTINDPYNPYFKPSEAYKGIHVLFNIMGATDEFIQYLIEHNYLTDLGFNPDDDNKEHWAMVKENFLFYTSFIRQYPMLN